MLDYQKNAASKLSSQRSQLAKSLNKQRNDINKWSGYLGKSNTNQLRTEALQNARGTSRALVKAARMIP